MISDTEAKVLAAESQAAYQAGDFNLAAQKLGALREWAQVQGKHVHQGDRGQVLLDVSPHIVGGEQISPTLPEVPK